ncbi:methionyl aminopeptidase [Amylostereum chailletii]|nr:methionyl aminopeptidase [Amylostereum chailletii]
MDEISTFGTYSVVLPPDEPTFGAVYIPLRAVPKHIAVPDYVARATGTPASAQRGDGRVVLGGEEERRVREAARLAREVLAFAGGLVKVGITTEEIDRKVHERIVGAGAYPSPLQYAGFPKSCCTSVNNVVVHGIPDERPLEDGDIVNIDITVYLGGFHGDTSRTFLVGDVDAPGRALVAATRAALAAGLAVCRPGAPFKDIGRAIHACAQARGYVVSEQFTGHGIGRVFHRPPWIVHTLNDEPGAMRPGDCFTIEPALIQGSNPRAWIFPDGWTASTENCARSAQEEHMVLITEEGADVITA